jgi:hypothetical protein
MANVFFICLLFFPYAFEDNYVIPDDYPLTCEMVQSSSVDNNFHGIYSLRTAWFRNNTLNQVLVIELGTDCGRDGIFHCYSDFRLPHFLGQIHFGKHRTRGVLVQADDHSIVRVFGNFIKSAKAISQSSFRSNKGIALGMRKDNAIKYYGKPDSEFVSEGIAVKRWDFAGDPHLGPIDKAPKIITKRYGKNSFGYHVEMYFRQDSLVAMILMNDEP